MAQPELVHIATMTAILGEQFVIKGGPLGTRIVANVDDVIIEGERLTARMIGKAAADWLTVALLMVSVESVPVISAPSTQAFLPDIISPAMASPLEVLTTLASPCPTRRSTGWR